MYAVLIRGINVGGKNKIPMSDLKKCLEDAGFSKVATYIASGNILLESRKTPGGVKDQIEKLLLAHFTLDTELIRVLVLTKEQLQKIIDAKPEGFGDHPDRYHSDVVFLIGVDEKQALAIFDPKEGVDTIWQGEGVIYSERLSALRTKSRLSKIVGTPIYQYMTIRNWNTTTKLLAMLNASV